jgi:hypothetical protein
MGHNESLSAQPWGEPRYLSQPSETRRQSGHRSLGAWSGLDHIDGVPLWRDAWKWYAHHGSLYEHLWVSLHSLTKE